MLSAYPACFIKEQNGYSVIFPDLDYLATCGNTLDKACIMARDCLAGYLKLLKEDNEEPPKASSVQDIDSSAILEELECEGCEAFVNMITVDVAEYTKEQLEKPVKKTLTIPTWLNNAASEQNIDLSQVLQDALKTKLHLE